MRKVATPVSLAPFREKWSRSAAPPSPVVRSVVADQALELMSTTRGASTRVRNRTAPPGPRVRTADAHLHAIGHARADDDRLGHTSQTDQSYPALSLRLKTATHIGHHGFDVDVILEFTLHLGAGVGLGGLGAVGEAREVGEVVVAEERQRQKP